METTPPPTNPVNPTASKPETNGKDTATPALPVKKDSTTDLPMFDFEEAINFVSAIQEKALEAVAMPEVAKGMGYTHPSSTPFYRRITAARLFGLVSPSRAELTLRAKEYLKPTREDARGRAVTEAVMSIPLYAEEVQKHVGKKLNSQFVANSFAKALSLTDGCAQTCARSFEASLKAGGFLSVDGVVNIPSGDTAPKTTAGSTPEEANPHAISGNAKTHALPLNKDGTRVLTVTAPLDITPKEIKRIQRWLEVTLLIDWADDENDEAKA